jgi:hypothetical protein
VEILYERIDMDFHKGIAPNLALLASWREIEEFLAKAQRRKGAKAQRVLRTNGGKSVGT